MANDSYCFRMTQKEEKRIRGNDDYEIIQTKKSGVYFLTSQLRHYGKQYKAAYTNYRDSQVEIEQKAMGVAASYTCVFEELETVIERVSLPLSTCSAALLHFSIGLLCSVGGWRLHACSHHRSSQVLAQLDVLLSFAVAAVEAPTAYTRPEMLPLGEGTIELVGSRHPCVEVVQDDKGFIPNDVSFSRSADGGGGSGGGGSSGGASAAVEAGDGGGGSGGLLHLITGP